MKRRMLCLSLSLLKIEIGQRFFFVYTSNVKNNIMSLCKKCGEKYTNVRRKWCNPCLIDNLKENFTKWTSGNEKIDNFIQEMQLKIDSRRDIVFEWISYNQFSD